MDVRGLMPAEVMCLMPSLQNELRPLQHAYNSSSGMKWSQLLKSLVLTGLFARWFLLSLRAGPFRVFNLCLRRQPLNWQSQINVRKEQEGFDSVADLELGQAATSRTTELSSKKLSEKNIGCEQPDDSASLEAAGGTDIELQSALRELAGETDLMSRLHGSAEIVLGELDVLTRIWESQAMLRRGKPSMASFERNCQRKSCFETRFRAMLGSWTLSQESRHELEEFLQHSDTVEFLNNATMVALEDFLAGFTESLEQARKRRELVQLLQRRDVRTEEAEANRVQASGLLEEGALKGHPVRNGIGVQSSVISGLANDSPVDHRPGIRVFESFRAGDAGLPAECPHDPFKSFGRGVNPVKS
ncbi:hypothetical protein AK812_SmicGene2287 [Symbiodinium microadriaticum]|uniref:Uncharacterized protein n=1 Tax=Symbiodinium microadriaticum TaxID=2951 RepID=A0A1Q9F1Q1_SYMMI|nr:hypothetical protein AK812_SmicGene2287 [Symbiodinium microadriaticum]